MNNGGNISEGKEKIFIYKINFSGDKGRGNGSESTQLGSFSSFLILEKIIDKRLIKIGVWGKDCKYILR